MSPATSSPTAVAALPVIGEQTMSSRQIAELCEKRHDHVLRDIRKMLVQLYGGDAVEEGLPDHDRYEAFFNKMGWGMAASPKLGDQQVKDIKVERDARGYVAEIALDYTHTMTLIAGYRVKLRKAVIDRWQQLEAERPAFDPATFFEDPAAMRGLLLTYTEKVIALETEVEGMRENVAAHERLTKADGSLNITEAAKNLGMRPSGLFDWLSQHGWIYKRPGAAAWLGYQDKCNRGLLEHKSTTVLRADGSEKITEQVRVTPKGLSALAKLIKPTAMLVA